MPPVTRKRFRFISPLILFIILFAIPAFASEITVIAVGDVLPAASWFDYEMPAHELLKNVNNKLFEADIVIGNLEEPLTRRKEMNPAKDAKKVKAGRDFVLKAEREETAQDLRNAGFTVMTLANNHTMDYREDGLLDTLELLGKAGIVTAGAGKDIGEAERPAVVQAGERKMVVLSATDILPKTYGATAEKPGVASLKEAYRLLENIIRAREEHPDGIIAVSVHWGVEATNLPSPRQRELAKMFIDSGADMVIGHHPHRLQGVEIYGGRPIFYSLGNFQFPTRGQGNESVMAVIKYNSESREPSSIELLPVFIEANGAPRLLTENEPKYKAILSNIAALNKDMGVEHKGASLVLGPDPSEVAQNSPGRQEGSIAPAVKKKSYY